MKAGEKRLVIIPPELAYGSQGDPPKIPRDASLVFTIELLGFDREH
jgi:FKBP-type peptidyl-prolyl cis-trans isomerase